MDASTEAERSSEASSDKKQSTYLKVVNHPANGNDLPKVPKRKLSVFYRSFDLITSIDQEQEKETIEFRRTSSSPSVRIERTQDSENNEICSPASSRKKAFVDDCRSLIDSDKGLSSSSPDRLSEKCSNNAETSASSTSFKLPQLREGIIIDNYNTITETAIGKHYKLNDNGNYELKSTVDRVAIDLSNYHHPIDVQSITKKEQDNDERNSSSTIDPVRGNSPETHPVRPRATRTDLVKIKDSAYPCSFVNASSAGRLGKYTSVDAEMSSHEDSSIGSDSEDDSIGRRGSMQSACARNEAEKNEGSRSKRSSIPSHASACFSTGEHSAEPDSPKLQDTAKTEDPDTKQAKRQVRFFAARRSLSESDSDRYHRARRHCKCIRQGMFDEQEQFPAFPNFTDNRLQIMGLSNLKDVDSVYRENLSENELELKYIAFSIGLSTDRITLQRRMAQSLRQRDQSERNFTDEIQKMQEDIQELSPLCTDRESIDRVEKVRRRLDMVARCAHGVSCAAETLGAVYQEHRISRAIFIADKYLQILRTRCENLAVEIAETKRILLRNNIVIEEGEIGDDLPKIRYRNGVPSNNRTMIARRRASIATISRPLSSQDMIKEGPRQRNSVSGRVTLRRPSLCSETQKWDTEKLNRTDSSNSAVELRDIFEQTESRRNSVEENNNLLRIDQSNTDDTVNCNVTSDVDAEERMINKQNSFLESNVTQTVEKQLKLCIRLGESLVEIWRSILWYMLIFFLGFYAKQITSC